METKGFPHCWTSDYYQLNSSITIKAWRLGSASFFFSFFFWGFGAQTYSVTQVGLEPLIILPQFPEFLLCWPAPPCLAYCIYKSYFFPTVLMGMVINLTASPSKSLYSHFFSLVSLILSEDKGWQIIFPVLSWKLGEIHLLSAGACLSSLNPVAVSPAVIKWPWVLSNSTIRNRQWLFQPNFTLYSKTFLA